MIALSGGFAKAFGNDISVDMQLIRQQMGVCPQHDILFPLLSVAEHLFLYGAIKGFLVLYQMFLRILTSRRRLWAVASFDWSNARASTQVKSISFLMFLNRLG